MSTDQDIILQIQDELGTQVKPAPLHQVNEYYRSLITSSKYSQNKSGRITGLLLMVEKVTDPLLNLIKELTELQVLNITGARKVSGNLNLLHELWELQHLIFTGSNLSDISFISEMRGLKKLCIRGTSRVKSFSALSQLTGLKELDLVDNHQVKDFSFLSKMKGLTRLDLDSNKLEDVFFLAGLQNLEYLFLSGNQLIDVSCLSELKNLKYLFLSNNQLTDVSVLAEMENLTRVFLHGNLLTDVSFLSVLENLNYLRLENNQITDVSFLSGMTALTNVNLENNPIQNPPPEIVEQGLEAIQNYFSERESQGTDQLYEAKVLLLGEGGAGKTTLLRRLYKPHLSMPDENETTKGIDIHKHEYSLANGKTMRLNVWDFGGQEIYHATHQFFLTKRSLYILLDDTRKDHRTVQDEGFKYWLEAVELLGDKSPVLIFQNEKGGRSKDIDMRGIKGRFPNVMERYAGNLEFPTGTKGIREAVELFSQQLQHIGEKLPAKWVNIRKDISNMAKAHPFIPIDKYYSTYASHLELDKDKALFLSDYLHDLGVFLHFQDDELLKRIVILQNEWATDAVFMILDNEKVKSQQGRFDQADCAEIWKDSKYSDMRPELLALMLKFELCYELHDQKPKKWLAPGLLPISMPERFDHWKDAGDLVLRYEYDFMPRGIINRLMVRMNRYVCQPELSWRNGAYFEMDEAELLAQVSASGKEIILRARGVRKKDLMVVISEDLDAINQLFPGLTDKLTIKIPCICNTCKTSISPAFYASGQLRKRMKAGKSEVECPDSFEDVLIGDLLYGAGFIQVTDVRNKDVLIMREISGMFSRMEKAQSENFEKLKEGQQRLEENQETILSKLSDHDRRLIQIAGLTGNAHLRLGDLLHKINEGAISNEKMEQAIDLIEQGVIQKLDEMPEKIQEIWKETLALEKAITAQEAEAQEGKKVKSTGAKLKMRIPILGPLLFYEEEIQVPSALGLQELKAQLKDIFMGRAMF